MKRSKALLLGAVLGSTLTAPALFSQQFGVWLDGVTSVPANDGILNSLNNAFGAGHYTLLSTAALSGSLAAYDTIIMSRSGANFGTTSIPASAVTNIQNYVGSFGSPTQGGVALFTNDAKDNWFGAGAGDPFDANLNQLFVNAATFAAATHHGFIGEFNGSVIALNQLALLPGSAGALHGTGQFTYGVGPIGAGHPIDNGVSFPFVDGDLSPFLTTVTGALPSTIVDVYLSEPLLPDGTRAPAVMANAILIGGGRNDAVPDAGSTGGLLAMALLGLFAIRQRTKK